MKTVFLPICLSIALAVSLFAAEQNTAPGAPKPKTSETPAPAEANSKPSADPSVIMLKNKSSFQVDAAARNPFWPIGFKPKSRIGGAGDADGEVPPSAFLVTSITLDGATHF